MPPISLDELDLAARMTPEEVAKVFADANAACAKHRRERRTVIEAVAPGESLDLATSYEWIASEGYAESMIREMCDALADRLYGARRHEIWGTC